MKRLLIIIALAAGPILLNAAHTPQKSKNTLYVVKPGDTLSGIAQKFHTSITALKKANKLADEALLHPGQNLKIPDQPRREIKIAAKKKKAQKPKVNRQSRHSTEEIYKVHAGDTLSSIALEQGVSLQALLDTNKIKADTPIRVGQELKIPGKSRRKTIEKVSRVKKKSSPKTEKAQTVHTVEYGDTLFSIARKYHTPLKDLMALNGIAPTDVIHPGEKLKIPGTTYQVKNSKTGNGGKAAAKRVVSKKKAAPESPREKAMIYTVRHGDTLWKIAKKHKVTIAQIRRLNKLKRKEMLHTGMKLLIKEGSTPKLAQKSKKAPIKTTAKTYTVKKGDTLWEIAKRHKTSVAQLRKLNKMGRGDIIHTGMKLTVGYTKVPPTRIAQKAQKAKEKKKLVAAKKAKKKRAMKAKTRVAAHTVKKSKRGSRKRKADRRISSALAALNSKGSSGRSGGGDYNVIRTAKRYLGRRYVWGAEGPSSFDCSGFTQYVMRKAKGVKLPRVSRKQAYYGKYVTRSQLKPGDLIFFDTSRRRRGYVNHVGIYIGNNKFIHASSARHRVVITSLNRPFYRARFKWGRRVN